MSSQRVHGAHMHITPQFERFEAGGVVTRTAYYGFGGQRVAMRVYSAWPGDVRVAYLHGDHLGSASLTTDAAGNPKAEQRYYPFGETRWVSPTLGTLPTDRRFTGQLELAGLGIYDYGARAYSPLLGRFLSADTIAPRLGDPQTLNHYAYSLNNPLKYTDPTGHDGCSFMIGLGGLWAAIATPLCQPPQPAQRIDDGPVIGPWSKQPWNIEKPVDNPWGELPSGDRKIDDPWGKVQPYDGPFDDGSKKGPIIISAKSGASNPWGDLEYASIFGIKPYDVLHSELKPFDLEAHHLIEKRFAENLNVPASKIPSVAVTKAEHQEFTNAWRSLIGYDNDNTLITTSNASWKLILMTAKEVYKDYPELLKAVEDLFQDVGK